jgi:hypothetical protein
MLDEAEMTQGSDAGAAPTRHLKISYIEDRNKRQTSFSKRKAGIMKKAYELSVLTGTDVMLVIASDSGSIFTFTTPKLKPLIEDPDGRWAGLRTSGSRRTTMNATALLNRLRSPTPQQYGKSSRPASAPTGTT